MGNEVISTLFESDAIRRADLPSNDHTVDYGWLLRAFRRRYRPVDWLQDVDGNERLQDC